MVFALLIASITDIKKREIPIWLFPLMSVLYVLINNNINLTYCLTGLLIGVISFSILAWKFSGGGGDIIMMGSIGFILGPKILMHVTIAASALCGIYAVVSNAKSNERIPYAPFVTFSYILCFLGGMFFGYDDYRILGIHYFLL